MTYQQAGHIAVLKRIAGWIIFIPAVISSIISLLKFIEGHPEGQPGVNAVVLDFAHVLIDMMRFNTPFLNLFWHNSPNPDFHHGINITFWIIFALIFIGLALQDSGARMARQARFLREGINDQMILERAKGDRGMTREQLESRVVVPYSSIFIQIFPMYVLPIIILVLGYFALSLSGFLN